MPPRRIWRAGEGREAFLARGLEPAPGAHGEGDADEGQRPVLGDEDDHAVLEDHAVVLGRRRGEGDGLEGQGFGPRRDLLGGRRARGRRRGRRGGGDLEVLHGYFFPLSRAARRSSAFFSRRSMPGLELGRGLAGHGLHLGDALAELRGVGLGLDLLQALAHHGLGGRGQRRDRRVLGAPRPPCAGRRRPCGSPW